jgi:hypothetical protein
MQRLLRNVWPELNASRTLFMLASGAAGLGCLAAACTVALMLSGPQPEWGLALGTGACFQGTALLLASGLMIPAAARERRSAPRAVAWGTLSAAALIGTAVVLAMMAGEPDALALCSVTCTPLVLGPGALALYYGMKARGDPLPVPPYTLYAPPLFPPARVMPPPALPGPGPLASEAESLDGPVQIDAVEAVKKGSASGAAAFDSPVVEAQSPVEEFPPTGVSSPQPLGEMPEYPSIDIAVGGANTNPKQKPCPSCGAMLDVPNAGGYVFCFQCGAQVNF